MNYLNLGCGYRFRHDWTNVDFIPTGDAVMVYDIRRGIPFAEASFDVVYHSHLLEHLSKAEALTLLRECYRVLRANGILRVVVPDLEQIARDYLFALEEAFSGAPGGNAHYTWMMLELYDQAVRNYSGGEMGTYLRNLSAEQDAFIRSRVGGEIQNIDHSASPLKRTIRERLLDSARIVREWLYRRLLRQEYHLLQFGRFRQGGEVHQWMYDRYSLRELLAQCGFQEIVPYTATHSNIPGWTTFHLDTEPDGAAYKPDSLYMEARKPTSPYQDAL